MKNYYFIMNNCNKKDTVSCIIMLAKQITKEGVLNEKLSLKKLLAYMKSVYEIPQKIKALPDKRKRKSIPFFNIVMPVFLFLTLQYESFHMMFSSPESMTKRWKHCIKGRIPKVDAVRDALARIDPADIQKIHEETIDRMKRNRIFREGTIDGYVVAAVDGVELFSSTAKSCPECLSRTHQNGKTEYFHRSVVCMTVGKNPHIILGQEMLKPRDGNEKDEGELTGGKRLIRRLKKRHGHFADVIVADALYLNAPFINTVVECGMDAVIRMKDERRQLYQDAKGIFEKGMGNRKIFSKDNLQVEVEELCDFEMEHVAGKVRVLHYHETKKWKEKEEVRDVWVVTTLKMADSQSIWKMMHKRWDIEENGFHQLKTYYHAKHCYCHEAVEVIFNLMILGFNMRELYLYRRLKDFAITGVSRKSVTQIFRDDLLLENVKSMLYEPGG